MYIINKAMRGDRFAQKEGTILKKSLENITVTTFFKTKDECKYIGNRIHAVIDEKAKIGYILITSSVSDISKVADRYKVTIDCDVLETVTYDTLKIQDLVEDMMLTNTWIKSEVMFFGYDTRDYRIGMAAASQNNGIWLQANADPDYQYAFAELKEGNTLAQLKRTYYSNDRADYAIMATAYPAGIGGIGKNPQGVQQHAWISMLPKFGNGQWTAPISINGYGRVLSLERNDNA